jgi:hypothetical protein
LAAGSIDQLPEARLGMPVSGEVRSIARRGLEVELAAEERGGGVGVAHDPNMGACRYAEFGTDLAVLELDGDLFVAAQTSRYSTGIAATPLARKCSRT